MKLETENEEMEIANIGAAKCPNLRSAWSQDILTYADGSPIPKAIPLNRCYCPECLEARRTTEESTSPAPYQGSNRRCRVCGAVDGVPYAKFARSLGGSVETETCELYRGLCNRPACKRNRRFQGEIPDVLRTHAKGSYPSGYPKTNWLLDPSEISIPPDLVNWAQNPLPSDRRNAVIRGVSIPAAFGILGWGRNTRYGSKIEYEPKDLPEPTAEVCWIDESVEWKKLTVVIKGMSQLDFGDPRTSKRETYRLATYKNDSGEWKTRRVIEDIFEIVGIGNRQSEAREFAEASRLYAYQRRSYYNGDPKTLAEYKDLVREQTVESTFVDSKTGKTVKTISQVYAVGATPFIVICGLNPTLEEIIAKQFHEKYRHEHPDKDDRDYLPSAVAYGETVGGTKESDEPLSEFYAQWAAKLNPGGWDWQNATQEQKATILGNPEFKRALYQMFIRTGASRVNELEPEKNPNTVAKWLWRELHNPLDSISEKDLANTIGRIGIAVILNNRATVKVIVPQDAPIAQMLDIFNGEKAKSIRTASKNAKQDAKRERLGKRATKDAINDAVRRVEQAYNDAADTIKFLHANSNTTNELAAKQDADVTFSTIGEGE